MSKQISQFHQLLTSLVWMATLVILTTCQSPAPLPLSEREPTPTPVPSTASVIETSVESYWAIGAEMPTGRWELSTSVVDGNIYAIGGAGPVFEALGTVEIYDPQ